MVIRKPVEYEKTFVRSRVLYKLDLDSIYPEKSAATFNVSLVRNTTSPNFRRKFKFVIEDKNVYFLTGLDRPSYLRVNVYFNSTVKPNEIRKYTKVFKIQSLQAQKTHLFKLRSTSSLEDILKSEKAILENFESKLWRSAKPCKDCLSIAYIHPKGENVYEIGVASTQPHSDLLEEFCFLGEIPVEYLNIPNFAVERRQVKCGTFHRSPTHPFEYYSINAFLTVDTKQVVLTGNTRRIDFP